jgi:hypothetical protein
MLSSIFNSFKTMKSKSKTKKHSPKTSIKSIPKTSIKSILKTSAKTMKKKVKIADNVEEILYTPSPEDKCYINNSGHDISTLCVKNQTKFPCKKKYDNGKGFTIFDDKEEWDDYLFTRGKIKDKKGKINQLKLKNPGMKSRKNVIETLGKKNKNKKNKNNEHFLEDSDYNTFYE